MNPQETKEAHALIRWLLNAGCALSVHDGEEITVSRSTDSRAVFAALATTEADSIKAWRADLPSTSDFLLIYGNGPGELIADHSDTELADAAWRAVQREAVPAAYRC